MAQSKRILIVEDDAPTQLLIATLLRRDGFDCLVAHNGGDATSLLEHDRNFGAIVLDLMMPTVDGRQVIDYLARSTDQRPPVIVCTAAAPRDLSQLNPDVVKAVIRKPFDIEHLSATVAAMTR
jgi:CheY-like chemotaxis protein